jgi:TPR repeat protein
LPASLAAKFKREAREKSFPLSQQQQYNEGVWWLIEENEHRYNFRQALKCFERAGPKGEFIFSLLSSQFPSSGRPTKLEVKGSIATALSKELNNPECLFFVAVLGPERLLNVLEKSRDKGSVLALSMLGRHYSYGEDADYEKAFKLLNLAVEKGGDSAPGMAFHGLGFLYQCGRGVEEDEDKAIFYFKKGAELRWAASCDALCIIYSELEQPIEVISFGAKSISYGKWNHAFMRTIEEGMDEELRSFWKSFVLGFV